jgi:hypothetical protein
MSAEPSQLMIVPWSPAALITTGRPLPYATGSLIVWVDGLRLQPEAFDLLRRHGDPSEVDAIAVLAGERAHVLSQSDEMPNAGGSRERKLRPSLRQVQAAASAKST